MHARLAPETLLERLIAFPSVSRDGNREIADFVADYLHAQGVACERFEYDHGRNVNLYAQVGPPCADRSGLVLCGHLDVVPADEPDWSSDPFTLTRRDGRWVGRGTADMKGFVALAIDMLIEAAGESSRLQAPLGLLLTADEELGSLGAAEFARARNTGPPLPRACLIGEPTSLRAVRMHKGHLKLRVRLRGRPGHSGSPHLGVNAIEPLGPVIAALTDLRRNLERERSDTSSLFSQTPFAVLNLARVRGGEALNVIPEYAELELGVRLLPGGDGRAMQERIERLLAPVFAAHQSIGSLERIHDNPPLLTPEDAPLHRALCGMIGQNESLGVSYASDAGVLQRDLGMECVLFGPGDIGVAHRADEHLPIDEFQHAENLLRELARSMLGHG